MPTGLDCLAITFPGFVMCDVIHVLMILCLRHSRLLLGSDFLEFFFCGYRTPWTACVDRVRLVCGQDKAWRVDRVSTKFYRSNRDNSIWLSYGNTLACI